MISMMRYLHTYASQMWRSSSGAVKSTSQRPGADACTPPWAPPPPPPPPASMHISRREPIHPSGGAQAPPPWQ
jgi:hypothetical protein